MSGLASFVTAAISDGLRTFKAQGWSNLSTQDETGSQVRALDHQIGLVLGLTNELSLSIAAEQCCSKPSMRAAGSAAHGSGKKELGGAGLRGQMAEGQSPSLQERNHRGVRGVRQ